MDERKLPSSLDDIQTETIEADMLIIGGGNAGCFVAAEAKEQDPSLNVVIMEKAHISRSGATAAGMDAINTYIVDGETPESLVKWSRAQVGGGPLREDLALSNAKLLNETV
ncbi:MAG: FAD-binding protein, partial [Deltaproteobacteria bacterium]|nr:FAD-binding protein [Deltaproteobacteria bacterium]